MRKLPLKKKYEANASTVADEKKEIISRIQQDAGFGFRKSLISFISNTFWTAIQFSGMKTPDFDKGEIYSLPLNIELKIGEHEFKVKSILMEADGTVFLRDDASDIDLHDLSLKALVKLSAALNEYFLKNVLCIAE